MSRVVALLLAGVMVAGPLAAADPVAQPPGSASATVGEDLQERVDRELQAGQPARSIDVLVRYDHRPDSADEVALERRAHAEVVWTFHRVPVIHARVPAISVAEIAEAPGVDHVRWDHPVHATLDTAAPAVQAGEFAGEGPGTVYNGRTAQALGYTGEGTVIAVLDTGVADEHPAFEGKWLAGASTSGETVECVNPTDDDGHGTHVAGIALGNDTGSRYKGAAPDAELVEIKVSTGPADATSGIMRAWEWILDYNEAIDEGEPLCGVGTGDRIDVATLSFGACCPKDAGSEEELIEALAEDGVVVTIAAGNSGSSEICGARVPPCRSGEQHSLSHPGVAAGAITVANVDNEESVSRDDDVLAPSSSRGPNNGVSRENLTDRYRKPEIAAPGTDIKAPDFTGGYTEKTGTSMATPLTAGVAALILQAGEEAQAQTGGENLLAPGGTGYEGNQNWASGEHPVRDALVFGADYKTAGVPQDMLEKWESPGIGNRTWNNGFGYGEANAFLSVCWAFQHVLEPAGAAAPAPVTDRCPTTEGGGSDGGNTTLVDLSISSVEPNRTGLNAGDTVTFNATVEVEGDPGANDTTVRFLLDGETPLGNRTLRSLPEDGTVTVTSDVWESTRGDHEISATVDPGDAIDEASEGNNERSSTFFTGEPVFYRLEIELPEDAGAGRTTIELDARWEGTEVAATCPSSAGTLHLARQGNPYEEINYECSRDAPGGSKTVNLSPGTYTVTWTAVGTGSMVWELGGIPTTG